MCPVCFSDEWKTCELLGRELGCVCTLISSSEGTKYASNAPHAKTAEVIKNEFSTYGELRVSSGPRLLTSDIMQRKLEQETVRSLAFLPSPV